MSKRSNLAGYRAGFVAGDPSLVARLLEVRKHAGMIVPAPVQAAMIAALGDDEHVSVQRARYTARRAQLLGALQTAGFTVDDSAAGLYLWSTRNEDCWDTVGWLAERGILAAPGSFYGAAGSRHVRIALTATDERIAAAVARLVRT
jgi:aspartate/methionine/tyrosine aminotransferase